MPEYLTKKFGESAFKVPICFPCQFSYRISFLMSLAGFHHNG